MTADWQAKVKVGDRVTFSGASVPPWADGMEFVYLGGSEFKATYPTPKPSQSILDMAKLKREVRK